MANFTSQQANACVITKCESYKLDGVHQYWEVEVKDEDGFIYNFTNEQIPGNANSTAIKSSLHSVLLNTEKIPTPTPVIPKVLTIEPKDDIIGNTIG